LNYQVVPYVGRISLTLTPQTGSNIIEVYRCPRCGPVLSKIDRDKNPIVSVNGFLKNFDAKTYLENVPEKAPPVTSLVDSEYESLMKAIEYERSAPKINVNVWTRRAGGQWDKVGTTAATNPTGFAFRQLTLLDYLTPNLSAEFGEGDSLGISLEDAGWGLISGSDQIVLSGSFVEEVALLSGGGPTIETIINNNSVGGSSAPMASGWEILDVGPAFRYRLVDGKYSWNNVNSFEPITPDSIGKIKFGYLTLKDRLVVFLSGALEASTAGNLTFLRLIRQSDDAMLLEKTGTELIGETRNNSLLYSAEIGTSAIKGEEIYVEFEAQKTYTSGTLSFVSIANEFIVY